MARRKIVTWLGSIQLRAILALAVVVVAPLVFVWLSEPYEVGLAYRIQLDLDRATGEAAQDLSNPAKLRQTAQRNAIRLRVLNAKGKVLQDLDYSLEQALVDRYVTVGLSKEQREELERYDEALEPLMERPAIKDVLSGQDRESKAFQAPGHCRLSRDKILLICDVAHRFDFQEQPVIVHVQSISPRSIRSLYDSRYQLLVLAIQVSVIAMIMGIWLGFRVVRPVNLLREQVRERSTPPVSTRPIRVHTQRDELAELAYAFNDLLLAIEESRQANLGFMADVAHEIKNPIAAVRACAESLGREKDVDAKRAARMGRALKTSSDRMDAMITRFLELARAEAGLPDEQREELELDVLVSALVEVFRCDERYLHVDFDVKVEPARVFAAPGHMESVIRNLVGNAASLVSHDDGEVEVEVRIIEKGKFVQLVVRDNGPGISAENLPHIFDRFFTRRADGSGTGLGLSMSQAIIKAHRGHIEVQSEPGDGAMFVITLPAFVPSS